MVVRISDGLMTSLKNVFPKKKNHDDSESFESMFAEKTSDAKNISTDLRANFRGKVDIISDHKIDHEKAAKMKAKESGKVILNNLEEIRDDLLQDKEIDREKITALTGNSDISREMIFDPQLNDILDQIELRAAVEAAKLEQNKEAV